MRVLYITAEVPYPLTSGYLRHYHILRGLSDRHDVTLMSLTRRPEVSSEAAAVLGEFLTELEVVAPTGPGRGIVRRAEQVLLRRAAARRLARRVRERLDTEMMKATAGRVISKIGAEGVYTVGVLPGARWPRGLGLALKIEDGEDRRARPTVVIESLRQLGALDAAALEALKPYSSFPIRNHRGDTVGEVRANFELEMLA